MARNSVYAYHDYRMPDALTFETKHTRFTFHLASDTCVWNVALDAWPVRSFADLTLSKDNSSQHHEPRIGTYTILWFL